MRLPEHLVGEILDGELVASPRPAAPHAVAGSGLLRGVLGPFHGEPGNPAQPGGWWILAEPELHLGSDVVVPDVAGWRHERMPRVPNVAAFTLPPDWICEVISPSTSTIDRSRKMPIYAREGVGHLWLVDPLQHTLEVYRLETSRWVVVGAFGGAAVARIEPFGAVELTLGPWWIDS